MEIETTSPVPVFRSFRAHPAALYEIRQFVRTCASSSPMGEEDVNNLILAVSEACANSIVHTTSPDIRLSWTLNGQCVHIEVRDQGVFKRRVPMPEVEGRGGHGITLMMALVDEFSIREGSTRSPGTTVRLVKCMEA